MTSSTNSMNHDAESSPIMSNSLSKDDEDSVAAPPNPASDKENGDVDDDQWTETTIKDPVIEAQLQLIAIREPTTELEIALKQTLDRKQRHIERLVTELRKLQSFVSKRKQGYKRKRKNDGAPTRAMSAYNIFIKERFAQLREQNEEALKSDSVDATMKRVPPANLVTKTGNEWKRLSKEEKAKYEVRAKVDKARYEKEMREFQRPDSYLNRKRSKTGYNMFFSAHVSRLKQSESGVPSERGSVARLVGTAWKQLSEDDRAYYEREADRFNVNQEGDKDEDTEVNDEEELKRQPERPPPERPQQQHLEYAQHNEMQQHMPAAAQMMHDHRQHVHYYSHPPHSVYGPPPPYFDYSQHHQRHHHHHQALAQGYQQTYPPQPRHYEG